MNKNAHIENNNRSTPKNTLGWDLVESFSSVGITHFGPPYPPNAVTGRTVTTFLEEWMSMNFPAALETFHETQHKVVEEKYVPTMGVEGSSGHKPKDDKANLQMETLQQLWKKQGKNVTQRTAAHRTYLFGEEPRSETLTLASFSHDKLHIAVLKKTSPSVNCAVTPPLTATPNVDSRTQAGSKRTRTRNRNRRPNHNM